MAQAAKKPRPMRSRKSGLKKRALYDANLKILKKVSEELEKNKL